MTEPAKRPKDMTMREMLNIPWVRHVHAALTLAAAVVVIVGIISMLTGCTVPNLPAPQTPSQTSPATGQSVTPSAAPTTLPIPTTTAPLMTPRTTVEPEPDVTWSDTVPMSPTPAESDGVDTANVVRVYDGDTITVELDGEKESVRLLGIDSPELDAPNIGVVGECYGKESGDALRALINGRQVQLIIDPEQGDAADDYRDNRGRLLRYVEVGDGDQIRTSSIFIDISEYQLKNGNAWVYEQYPVSRTPLYQIAMSHAQDAHNGLWAACE